MFPIIRPRRLRQSETIRKMVRETRLSVDNLVMPIFVHEGAEKKIPIKSMPGIFQFSLAGAVEEAKSIERLNIPSIIIFGIPNKKDDNGSEAYNSKGIVQRAISAIKEETNNLLVIADSCLCEYTNHGHCGIIKNNHLDNDLSLEFLQQTALSQAKAGADIIAPSAMLDGMVGAIRQELDEHGFENIPIMSYSVKYASAYYGPFREAAGSADNFKGDRKSHQMDYGNSHEALKEAWLDVEEGADILMVKPALAYLDIIAKVKQESPLPLAAYNVSGEYSMIMNGINSGFLDKSIIHETLLSIKRAGADIIITYFAKTIAEEIS